MENHGHKKTSKIPFLTKNPPTYSFDDFGIVHDPGRSWVEVEGVGRK
jgi:hypothetical protein